MTQQRMIGASLMVVGVLLLFNIIPLATIIYPAHFWYSLYPDGTSDDPALITIGETISPTIKLVYHDATANIRLPSPAYWKVSVTIDGSTINFGLPDEFLSSVKVNDHWCTVAVWQDSWTVPAGEGVTYTFIWKAVIYDGDGTYIDTKEKTTYAKTALDEPDGYFTINGLKASEVTTHVVLEPTLKLGFVATKNPEKLTEVYVEVLKGGVKVSTVTLTGEDSTYSATYTLPSHGTYELKGYYTWTGSTTPIRKMSVTASWGEEALPFKLPISGIQIFGALLIAAGVVLAVKPMGIRRRIP